MKKLIVFIAAMTLMLSGVTAWAGAVTIPNVFTPNTPAKADSVNENFSAVDVAVDNNAAMITSLQNAHSGTRTGYVSISAGSLTPTVPSVIFTRFGGISIYPADATTQTYIAGVNLPHGAIITAFSVKFYDNDITKVGNAQLRAFCGSSEGPIATVQSIAGSNTITDSTISFPDVVDNMDCNYNIQVWYGAGASIQASKFIIEYEYTLD